MEHSCWPYSDQDTSLSLQAEEIAIECGAENVFFCESENATKSIKVTLLIVIVHVHVDLHFISP